MSDQDKKYTYNSRGRAIGLSYKKQQFLTDDEKQYNETFYEVVRKINEMESAGNDLQLYKWQLEKLAKIIDFHTPESEDGTFDCEKLKKRNHKWASIAMAAIQKMAQMMGHIAPTTVNINKTEDTLESLRRVEIVYKTE